ncbi:MAG TPA: hypothetical protein VLA49_13085, partial [Anaerolineales bacterium]|nr:hypothetical protein [Anaerolineales bacterium]
MPGLVGFVGQEYPDEGQEHLRKMTLALEPSPEYRVDIYHEPGIGLGWVGHKFVDAGPQPCWNESKTLCAVMEGELYNSAELRQDLIQRGESVQTNSEIELV